MAWQLRLSASRLPPCPPVADAWCPSPCGRLSRPPRWVVTPTTTTAPPWPWGSRPVGHPAFPQSSTCERDVGAPSVPLKEVVPPRPPGGGFARRPFRRAIRAAPPQVRCGGCVLPSLETGVQAIRPSPCRAGLASPDPTHLRAALAFPPCCCPPRLSPQGRVGDPEVIFLHTSPRWAGDR